MGAPSGRLHGQHGLHRQGTCGRRREMSASAPCAPPGRCDLRPSAPSWGWAYAGGGAPGGVARCASTSARGARSPGGVNTRTYGARESGARLAGQMHPTRPTGPALGACRPGPGPTTPTHPKGRRRRLNLLLVPSEWRERVARLVQLGRGERQDRDGHTCSQQQQLAGARDELAGRGLVGGDATLGCCGI